MDRLSAAWPRFGATFTNAGSGGSAGPRVVSRFAVVAVTGLGLLGLTSTAVWLSGRLMHAEVSLTALEINVASRQRTLVERLVEQARELMASPDAAPRVQPELAACADLLMRSHVALSSRNAAALRSTAAEGVTCSLGDEAWSHPAGETARSTAGPVAADETLDGLIRHFAATALLASESANSRALGPRLDRLMVVGSEALPRKLDLAVAKLQQAADEQSKRWLEKSDVALLLVYVGLAGVWLGLFRPMARATTKTVDDLARSNALLAERTKDLEETNRRLAETADRFRTSEERFRLLFDLAPVGLCLTDDTSGRIVMASRALSSMSGHSPDALRQMSLDDLAEGRHASPSVSQINPVEISLRHASGGPIPIIYSELSFSDGPGDPLRLASFQDISWRQEHENRLWRAAHIDLLTGLPNRLLLTSHLSTTLAQQPDEHVAMCIVDIDDFKAINDVIGRGGGEAYLRAVAERLRGCMVEGEFAARIGSDEFALVLPLGPPDRELSRRIDDFRTALTQPFVFDGVAYSCSVSIGSATAPRDGATEETLIANADIAVNNAKAHRGSYVQFQPALRETLQKRIRVCADILAALERGEMELFYQPIVRVRTRQHAGFEALIRWRNPDQGIVGPAAFLEALEEPKSAAAIGRFVVERAFSQVREWQRAGLPVGKVAINLSAADVRSGLIVGQIEQAIARHGIAPSSIGIEITENVFLGLATTETARDLQRLRDMGFEVAFDDFGTGYASLTHVRRLPINRIKIDRSFIATLTTSADDRAIVCAMIGMAHGVGLRVTAEGVEDEATLDLLGRLGCHEVQGYLLGHPMPPGDVPAYLASHKPADAVGPRPLRVANA